MVYNRTDKTSKELLPTWDRNADAYLWSPDMSGILVQTTDAGRDKLFRAVFARGGNGLGVSGVPQIVVGDHNNTAFSISRDGRSVVWLRDATEFPAEVYVADLMAAGAANVRALTHENDALVASLAVNPAEDFWFTGAAGLKVQGFIVKPPNWQPGKKYPAILLIHGGPQGAWLDQWHGRWNYQMFATTGAALVIINPRGSFGYGQQFVDDVLERDNPLDAAVLVDDEDDLGLLRMERGKELVEGDVLGLEDGLARQQLQHANVALGVVGGEELLGRHPPDDPVEAAVAKREPRVQVVVNEAAVLLHRAADVEADHARPRHHHLPCSPAAEGEAVQHQRPFRRRHRALLGGL